MADLPQATNCISEHSFVQCHLSCQKPTLERKTISFRQLGKIDLDKSPIGSEELQNKDERNLDDFVKLYHENLTKRLDKHAPLTKVSGSETKLTLV